jgi:hypothetical protein
VALDLCAQRRARLEDPRTRPATLTVRGSGQLRGSPRVAGRWPRSALRDERGQPRVALRDEPINKTLVLLANMVDTAVELDGSARSDQRIGQRPMIAVMTKSGLRFGGGPCVRWPSVDTAHQRLAIEHAKTAAGVGEVDLSLDRSRS